MGMALLYAVLRLDGNPDKCGVDWCAAAIDDVEKCQAYLRSFCKGECLGHGPLLSARPLLGAQLTADWPHTRGLSHTFDCFAARAIAQLQLHFASPSATSHPEIPAMPHPTVVQPPLSNELGDDKGAVAEAIAAAQPPPDTDTWAQFLGHDKKEGDVDALLAMLGWNAEWLPELLPNF